MPTRAGIGMPLVVQPKTLESSCRQLPFIHSPTSPAFIPQQTRPLGAIPLEMLFKSCYVDRYNL